MLATIADEQAHHDWTYQAVRPLPVPPSWKAGQAITADCSKAVQMLAHWAGGPDPMGNGFGPYGNSQTLWLKLQHLASPDMLLIGDIVTFGPDGSDHAAFVQKRGVDPLLWSDGHQGAPNNYLLSQDGRPAQYLRYPVPTYKPTQEDVLRARTDWFAWCAWRLGEGDWRHYGPANATVRPDVPAVIPASWWMRWVKFLAARNKGTAASS
jgi:hypothetical protein